MKVAVAAEAEPGEPRVAATPETVKKMIGLGAEVAVEPGAGIKSGILDADYAAAGANVTRRCARRRRRRAARCAGRRRRNSSRYKKGAMVIAIMDPYGNEAALRAMADAGVTALRHGADAAHHPRAGDGRAVEPGQSRRLSRRDRRLRRIRPRAADDDDRGRHGAGARVFVMGVGVAGLQAIATARRLGAVVTATDVRPAAKEQVESLGAKFIAVEDEEFKRGRDRRRLRQGNVEGVPGQAGRARRRAHQEAGHRHHHRAHSRAGRRRG